MPLPLTFQSRVLLVFVILVGGALVAESVATYSAAERTSVGLAKQQLAIAARVLQRTLESRDKHLRETTSALALDFGFREAIASRDVPTIVSALTNQSARIHADVAMLLSEAGGVIASTDEYFAESTPRTVVQAFARARAHDYAPAVIQLHDRLMQLIIVPIQAPQTIGWVGIGFYLTDEFALEVKEVTAVDVSLLLLKGSVPSIAASTLPRDLQPSASQAGSLEQGSESRIRTESLGEEDFLTLSLLGSNSVAEPFMILLQMPMQRVVAPMLALRSTILYSGAAICLIGVGAAVYSARVLAQPVRALADAALSLSQSNSGAAPNARANGDDLTQVTQAFHALVQGAHYDALTGLPNRVLFSDRLDAAIGRAIRDGESCTVIFIDLDGFKRINDSLGHEMGDLVLRKTAERLVRVLGPPHTIARLGGDEFVVLLEGTDQTQGVRLMEKLTTAVAQRVEYPGGTLQVGISAGMATCPLLTHHRDVLLTLADTAMYRSKTRKKGAVVASFADLNSSTQSPEAQRLDRRLLISAQNSSDNLNDWSTRMLATHGPATLPAISPRAPSMRPAAVPRNEVERLMSLYSLGLLDATPSGTLDHVTLMIAKSLKVPFVLVSLVDDKRQWFLSRQGIDVTETAREIAFCAHVVFEGQPLIVPDATLDERFSGNPLVMGTPHIRAYAGMPICSRSGYVLGTLCAIDVRPRVFDEESIDMLQGFATVVEELIQARVARTRPGALA